uniref:Secreted protein n=1 Tax=Steinernema glaseri TaxID=37863 RepID=A0A1I7ZPS4_9BILA
MRCSAVPITVFLLCAVVFAVKDDPTPVDCYWTDCVNPFAHDTCKPGYIVKKWEYCFWPWKKEYCCFEKTTGKVFIQ